MHATMTQLHQDVVLQLAAFALFIIIRRVAVSPRRNRQQKVRSLVIDSTCKADPADCACVRARAYNCSNACEHNSR